jgi:hypothetical protein
MSSGEINRDALREIRPSISLGCFVSKPNTIDYLVERIIQEWISTILSCWLKVGVTADK